MKIFGVKELIVVLMDVHKTKSVTTYTIPSENIERFKFLLEDNDYKTKLDFEDLKEFQTKEPDVISFKLHKVDITITENIFFGYDMGWECSNDEFNFIKKLWYICNYGKDASDLTQIPSWAFFKYYGNFYQSIPCSIDMNCSFCTFYKDKSCTEQRNSIINKCYLQPKGYSQKHGLYYEPISAAEIMRIHDIIPQYYDLDTFLEPSIIETPTLTVEKDSTFNDVKRNMVDVDKFISKIPEFEKQQKYISKIDGLVKMQENNEFEKINKILINYHPKNAWRGDDECILNLDSFDLPQDLYKEICECVKEKMIEYKKKLENEVKHILLK